MDNGAEGVFAVCAFVILESIDALRAVCSVGVVHGLVKCSLWLISKWFVVSFCVLCDVERCVPCVVYFGLYTVLALCL